MYRTAKPSQLAWPWTRSLTAFTLDPSFASGQKGAPARNIRTSPTQPLPVLEAGDVVTHPANRVYGPGEEPRPREGEPTASVHGELL